jgi:hypothetical protein
LATAGAADHVGTEKLQMSNIRNTKKFVSANFSVDCSALNAENSKRFVDGAKSNKQQAASYKQQAASNKHQASSGKPISKR